MAHGGLSIFNLLCHEWSKKDPATIPYSFKEINQSIEITLNEAKVISLNFSFLLMWTYKKKKKKNYNICRSVNELSLSEFPLFELDLFKFYSSLRSS
jgi:hypothetical protein